uniref:Yippee domain-containing protein n=1 Tax=Oryza rufipogon TaxID=4529 RepID=A0A0E0R9M3_ORYRU
MAELVGPRVYSCCHCRNHVCLHDDIISKAFQGRNGRAFLFSHAMNISMGPKEDRQLMTGLHTVADIYCRDCREVLGWKYERAFEESQKYKEGKFIFEKAKILMTLNGYEKSSKRVMPSTLELLGESSMQTAEISEDDLVVATRNLRTPGNRSCDCKSRKIGVTLCYILHRLASFFADESFRNPLLDQAIPLNLEVLRIQTEV